jgi:glycerol uptake facilitator-like aquaporin
VGFKGLVAATAAVALMTAPTVAAAQSAAEVAPASESVDSGSELRGGFIIPLIAIVAIILGILAATSDNDDDLPETP